MAERVVPEDGDVVVRRKPGDPAAVYRLGTLATPDQFLLRTRDEAVSQAVAFAKRQHVRAWFANGDDDLVLLGTFREEILAPGNAWITLDA